MKFALALSLLTISGVASAQSLDFTGDCPGPVTIDVAGITPGGNAVFLMGAAGEGSDVIGVGACAGTVTGLSGLRFLTRATDADGDGSLSFSPTIPDGRCDTSIQVLDTTSCALTNVATAASAPPELCSVVAQRDCEAKGWTVVGFAEAGNIVCTIDGRSTGNNCDTCDTYNIYVWEAGSPERHCPDVYSTLPGVAYSAHTPCACGDNLDPCFDWDMAGCIPD
ncbi:MAG: hypothetical protein ACI9K2_003314 [Myxococcota bacterium]|jgi:hypothetical protein